ncbi:MAG: type II toxin-antitoxin system VapB family antitoxin [Chloroflexi bacterium]|nr:type II toxin-antitoxin system VapB family antitoxin [Chloroflexota bacterium]
MGRTTLDIDADLLRRAMELSGVRTKTDAINLALREYVRQQQRRQLIDLLGNFDLDLDLDELRRLRQAD